MVASKVTRKTQESKKQKRKTIIREGIKRKKDKKKNLKKKEKNQIKGRRSRRRKLGTVIWHQRQCSPVMPLYDLMGPLHLEHLALQLPSTQWWDITWVDFFDLT